MSRSGDIYQRLDKLEDELKTENSYRRCRSERISDIENNVGWIMFALKAAATVYYARAFAVWWIKSLRGSNAKKNFVCFNAMQFIFGQVLGHGTTNIKISF